MEQYIRPRKRVANFTAHEKALLVHLIKKYPVIKSKLTDGKSVAKKKLAWISISEEFNSNAHVLKRNVNTLKRAWDNLKAMARKTKVTEQGYLKTGGEPSNSPPPPQQREIVSNNEEEQNKKTRKRVANFTAYEKALLVHLIKKKPILKSKLNDGKSVTEKKLAWISISEEFNSNAHIVAKRDVITLKRAWDNLKAVARKSKVTEQDYHLKTGGGPSNPPPPPPQEATVSIKDEAAPVICEIINTFDSDGTVLSSENGDEIILNFIENDIDKNCSTVPDPLEDSQNQNIEPGSDFCSRENSVSEDSVTELCTNDKDESLHTIIEKHEQRKPPDYVRREGVLRIKHFEAKKKLEMQILTAKLETQQIKKRAAEMEEEKNKTLLEMAKLELAEFKKRLDLQ